MAQITTTLPVEFSGSSSTYTYTRERDILSMSIQAPQHYNYLPTESSMKLCTCEYIGIMTKKANCFHYDFNNLQRVESASLLQFYFYDIFTNTLGKTYTLTYRISNCAGSVPPKTMWWRVTNTGGSNHKDIQNSVPITNGVFSINIDSIWWELGRLALLHERFVYAYDFSFDLEIISLVEGETALERNSSSIEYSPIVAITNEHAMLGNYALSRKIRRHLIQTERNITAMKDLFNITWR